MPDSRSGGLLRAALLSGLVVLCLAACKTEREKAADLVVHGAAREQAGDIDGARSSYVAAISKDTENIDARRALAALNLRTENPDGARAQYSALRERRPDDLEANLVLAELSLADENIPAAATYAAVVLAADPDTPRAQALSIALDYHAAETVQDATALASALDRARALVARHPDAMSARRIIIRSLMFGSDPAAALPEIDAALAAHPGSLELQMARLNVLGRIDGGRGAGAQLKLMYEKFPDNPDIQTWLSDWYLSEGQPDETIAFLLDLADRHGRDPAEHDRIADYVASRFPAAAAAERIESIARSAPPGEIADGYRARAAVLRFELGETGPAIATMRELVAEGMPLALSPVQRTRLAGMLNTVGETDEALRLVDEVLTRDPNQTDALVLRAGWLLKDEKPSEAISVLRVALATAPSDPTLLTMLADAYEAAGSGELAGSTLADAVAASENGVRESILFIRFLLRTDKKALAEAALAEALKAHPENPDLMSIARLERLEITQ